MIITDFNLSNFFCFTTKTLNYSNHCLFVFCQFFHHRNSAKLPKTMERRMRRTCSFVSWKLWRSTRSRKWPFFKVNSWTLTRSWKMWVVALISRGLVTQIDRVGSLGLGWEVVWKRVRQTCHPLWFRHNNYFFFKSILAAVTIIHFFAPLVSFFPTL